MKKFIFALAAIIATPIANARSEIPPVYVFAEDGNDAYQICRISNNSATAAVKAALRYNRIEIVREADSNGFTAYFSINPIYLKPYNLCAISISLRFYEPVIFPISTGRKPIRSRLEFCNKEAVATLSPSDAQDRLNAFLREIVDMCVSEIEAELKK